MDGIADLRRHRSPTTASRIIRTTAGLASVVQNPKGAIPRNTRATAGEWRNHRTIELLSVTLKKRKSENVVVEASQTANPIAMRIDGRKMPMRQRRSARTNDTTLTRKNAPI